MENKKSRSILGKYNFDQTKPPPGVQEIAVVSGSWYDMGRQYVQQCREGYLARLADMMAEYIEVLGSSRVAQESIAQYIAAAREDFPQLIELLQGMSDESQTKIEESAIVLYGKSVLRVHEECSHVAAWGSATANGHLIAASNIDMPYDAREYLPAVLAYPKDGFAFISCELFHRDCLNEKGLILQGSGGQNAGPGGMIAPTATEPRHMWNDVNIFCIAYCTTAKEAVEKYQSWKYIAGCNQFFGDSDHDAYIMEFTASKCAVRRAGDNGEKDYLIANNGYLSAELQDSLMVGKDYWDNCLPRYWTVEKMVQEQLGHITMDTLAAAEGSYGYFIPEGWSLSYRPDWETKYWYHDTREPYPSGWHTQWDLETQQWSPQMKDISVRTILRHVMDADSRTYCLMKGQSERFMSCQPGSTGTFWKLVLKGEIPDVIAEARAELELQLWVAARDIYNSGRYDPFRESCIEMAKQKMYEGINCRSFAVCAGELNDSDESNYWYGRALSAFCAGQCYARMARDNPNRLTEDDS